MLNHQYFMRVESPIESESATSWFRMYNLDAIPSHSSPNVIRIFYETLRHNHELPRVICSTDPQAHRLRSKHQLTTSHDALPASTSRGKLSVPCQMRRPRSVNTLLVTKVQRLDDLHSAFVGSSRISCVIRAIGQSPASTVIWAAPSRDRTRF